MALTMITTMSVLLRSGKILGMKTRGRNSNGKSLRRGRNLSLEKEIKRSRELPPDCVEGALLKAMFRRRQTPGLSQPQDLQTLLTAFCHLLKPAETKSEI